MAYVTVPKDLTKIKSKVMFNLTKRQLICFSAAVAIGLPLFFLVKDSVGTTTAALCMEQSNGKPQRGQGDAVLHRRISFTLERGTDRSIQRRDLEAF